MTIPLAEQRHERATGSTAGLSSVGVWIPVGSLLFIMALAGSAAAVPELRRLHSFQALIYVAVIVYSRRGNGLAFGAGTTVAIAWNALNLFVTHLMQAGAREAWVFLRTAQTHRLDTMLVFIGGVSHFVLIAACLTGFIALNPDARAWRRFALGGLIGMLYMAAIIAAFRPR